MNGSNLMQTNVLSGLDSKGGSVSERERERGREKEKVSLTDLCVSLWSQSEDVEGS